MYLLEIDRSDICERGTNKFFWKIAKNHIDDLFLTSITFTLMFTRTGELQLSAQQGGSILRVPHSELH